MYNCLIVFIGGGLGATLRYLLNIAFSSYLKVTYPYGTFIINITGSFFLGLIIMISLIKTNVDPRLTMFLTIGLAGGFTTFSTFSYEAFDLFNRGLILSGLLYIIFSIVLSIICTYLGVYVAKLL